MKVIPIRTIISEIKYAKEIKKTIKMSNNNSTQDVIHESAKAYIFGYNDPKPSFWKILFTNLREKWIVK